MASVLWMPAALGRLADVWTSAPDRQAVTEAVSRIDRALASGPTVIGESRDRDERIVVEPPLVAVFAVGPGGQAAFVLDVWASERRRPR